MIEDLRRNHQLVRSVGRDEGLKSAPHCLRPTDDGTSQRISQHGACARVEPCVEIVAWGRQLTGATTAQVQERLLEGREQTQCLGVRLCCEHVHAQHDMRRGQVLGGPEPGTVRLPPRLALPGALDPALQAGSILTTPSHPAGTDPHPRANFAAWLGQRSDRSQAHGRDRDRSALGVARPGCQIARNDQWCMVWQHDAASPDPNGARDRWQCAREQPPWRRSQCRACCDAPPSSIADSPVPRHGWPDRTSCAMPGRRHCFHARAQGRGPIAGSSMLYGTGCGFSNSRIVAH